MVILKDIKELVGINTEEEYDDEVVEETSRTLSKREQMEMDTVDDFRYDDYSTIFIDPKQFEDCKKIANYRKYWSKRCSKNNGFLSRSYGN